MKQPFHKAILTIALLIGVTPVLGQITNSEGSAVLLASHCAASSGNSIDNYQNYGKKLALTLSLLSPEAQARVFGDYNPGAVSAASAASATPDEPSSIAPILDLLNDINETLFGGDPGPEPIIAGEPPMFLYPSSYADKAEKYAAKAEALAESDPEKSAYYFAKSLKYLAKAGWKNFDEAEKVAKYATKDVGDAIYELNKAQEDYTDLMDKVASYQAKSDDYAASDPDKAASYAAKANEYAAEALGADFAIDMAESALEEARDAEKNAWGQAAEAELLAGELERAANDDDDD